MVELHPISDDTTLTSVRSANCRDFVEFGSALVSDGEPIYPERVLASEPIGYEFYRGRLYANMRNRRVLRDGKPLDQDLTPLEFDILVFFLQRCGTLVRRDSIDPLNEVKRFNRLPADNYIVKINKKLGFRRGECFRSVRRHGYLLDTDVREDHDEAGELHRIAEMHFNEHTLISMRRSLEESLKAHELNPYAPDIDVTLAYQYIDLGHSGYAAERPAEVMPKARKAAQRALRINQDLGSAHGILGLISLIFDYDWAAAEVELKHALDLAPHDSGSMVSYAHLLVSIGRPAEGLELIERAVRIDPTDKIVYANRGWLYTLAGDLAKGTALAKEAADRFPELPPTHYMLGLAYEFQGKQTEALESYMRSHDLELAPPVLAALGHLYGTMGNRALAMSFLQKLLDLPKDPLFKYVPAYCEALVYAGVRDEPACLNALEAAYEQRCDWLIHLNVEPRWHFVRSVPRFKELKKRVGLP